MISDQPNIFIDYVKIINLFKYKIIRWCLELKPMFKPADFNANVMYLSRIIPFNASYSD